MNLTKADAALLGRRRAQPTPWAGELLCCFVHGRLVNTKNARLHWKREMDYKRTWKERVWETLRLVGYRPGTIDPATPKRVTLDAIVRSRFDAIDGLRVACAPIVDALLVGTVRHPGAGILSDDRDAAGHVVEYDQEAHRRAGTVYGVRIGVSLLEGPR